MALDDTTREKILHANDTDENYDHLRIECRAKDRPLPHQSFGERLFQTMKSVSESVLINRSAIASLNVSV